MDKIQKAEARILDALFPNTKRDEPKRLPHPGEQVHRAMFPKSFEKESDR